ncbi:NAD(P)-dependent oxidoreductase [Saccharothrix obliqua]|uniref:NAD(P)-dependent oxidoreductase n=1 Tax=Saccharothrix obliqua TaxID=2861747 RepID=UPI001C5F11E0|nr:NAD(P)H-binding protein [Saccharothrix obliqua]MBW4721688.1 NAD(P)H-binding protein [Saccharothrix obliqua]
MKVTVFGATGGTGTRVVARAQAAGHDVVAVVRTANGRDVVADVLDPDSIGPVIAGSDAVVTAIGARGRGPTTVQTDTTASIVEAMKAHGVRRLVVVSNSGMVVDEHDDALSRYVVKPILRRVFKHPWADMADMERVVRASGLEWTIVRPPRLTDGPRTGKYRTAVDTNLRRGTTISRGDLADLVVGCLDDPATTGHAVAVGY